MDDAHAQLAQENAELLQTTTARLVNRAVERRVERVVADSRQDEAIGRLFWPLALAFALGVLFASLVALALHVLR